jgi:two-component system sensor histidine kinase/response regulator
MAAALNSVDGDAELLKELAAIFLCECPRWMAEIRQAIDQRDASKLHQTAHTLKGSVGNFGARAALLAAQRLETDGREKEWGQAEKDWAALEEAISRLEPVFVELGHAGVP